MDPKPLRVALYARVSTAEEKELQDPEVQLSILREFCTFNRYELVGEYTDHASGSSGENRPQFQQMIKDAEAGRFQAVICLRLDRFMRDAVEGMVYLKKLEKAGVKFIMARDPLIGSIDTSTDLGQLVLMVIFQIGKIERKNTLLRSKEGIDHFIEKNGYWGRGKNKRPINLGLAVELLKVRGSLNAVAKELGIPRSTLEDRLKSEGVEFETLLTSRNSPRRKTPASLNTSGEGAELTENGRIPEREKSADREAKA